MSENDTEVFTTEKKYNEGKTRNIIYLVNETGQLNFYIKRLKTLDCTGYINTLARHFTQFYWKLTKDLTRFTVPTTTFPKIPY